MPVLGEAVERRCAHALGRRVGRDQLGVLLLERLQLPVQRVVLRVVDLRPVEDVVQVRVVVDLLSQGGGPGRRFSLAHRSPSCGLGAQAQGEQLAGLVEPVVGPRRKELLAAEDPPRHGRGGHAGGAAGLDVERAVAHIDRPLGGSAEALQTQEQRRRRRLVLGGVARRDHHLEVLAQAHGAEGHLRRVGALAGDDAEPPAGRAQRVQHLGDALVAADELVVTAVVVLAVGVVERLRPLRRQTLHLLHERPPDAGEDDLVGQFLLEHCARGVAERLDDKLYGVHHRAVDGRRPPGRSLQRSRSRSRSRSQLARPASRSGSSRS